MTAVFAVYKAQQRCTCKRLLKLSLTASLLPCDQSACNFSPGWLHYDVSVLQMLQRGYVCMEPTYTLQEMMVGKRQACTMQLQGVSKA